MRPEVPEKARTVRTEWAEWDLTNEMWKAPLRVTIEEFRPDGKLLVSEYRNPDGSVSRSVNSYDDAGLPIESRFESGDGAVSQGTCSYDHRGRLIRSVSYASDGSVRLSVEIVYAADGSYTRVIHFPHMQGDVMFSFGDDDPDYSLNAPGATTAFGGHGRESEILLKGADGNLLRRMVRTRDESGRLVKDELFLGGQPLVPDIPLFGAGASLMTSEYTYDERGRRVEVVRRMFGLSEDRETIRYDDRGNRTETTTEHQHREANLVEGNIEYGEAKVDRQQQTRFAYRFDARGNWTERVTSQRYGENPDFTPCSMERREIAYYDEPAGARDSRRVGCRGGSGPK
jgi:hypothetical protein